ncbi:DoxX family membrane protein [Tunicatimonas pelagia]|uniref:DoxX family membrane protein n=1 Tax=Tunicatimonas pelagia TaxID=931531 RepID=UPI002665D9CE|nr:DoxX family membrane protein [Tunicatimonas pelagia]WKN41937.1 DoxX family membrane protein [Tunicatimonas pelagia]
MKTAISSLSPPQLNVLVILRVLIGWHFLYEGVVKLYSPSWSAAGYLNDSQGWFAPMFETIAANPSLMAAVDFLNTWGLVAVGLSLLVGFLTQAALIGGMVLLGLYYLSHPPFIGAEYALPSEGSYLWVNKNLIELFAMAVLYVFPTSHIIGLDRLMRSYTQRRRQSSPEEVAA